MVTIARQQATALTRETRVRPEQTAAAPPRPVPGLSEEVHVGSFVLLPRRTALRGRGSAVPLTVAEWSLLTTLIERRGEVLDRSGIATQAWGPNFAGRHNEVEVYVSRLRRKLRTAGAAARIETVRGRGYRLSCGPDPLHLPSPAPPARPPRGPRPPCSEPLPRGGSQRSSTGAGRSS
jgi:DNA-binding response OmpR family regulator